MITEMYVIFTDLDGTLLHHDTYSYDNALPGLRLLREHNVPVVFCSAKTRAEQTVYREALHVHDPFIVENGGAVFAETGYFQKPHGFTRKHSGLHVLEFGRPYEEIRRILTAVRTEIDVPAVGYGDMTVEAVARLTGLDLEGGARAKEREYEETVVSPLDKDSRERLRAALANHQLYMTAGARFLSISAANDKGRAALAVADMYRQEWGQAVTVGIGDSWNDASLLSVVDIPFLVQRPGGHWEPLQVDGIHKVKAVGPEGWTEAVRQLLAARTSH